MVKTFANCLLPLLAIAVVVYVSGCGRSEDQKKSPENRTTEQPTSHPGDSARPFQITFPSSNSHVDRNIITIRGIGARPNGAIVVEVLTDRWYLQDGHPEIEKDGNWTYAPCYLMGKGSYRFHHSIRARQMVGAEVRAVSMVEEVEAPEPE